MSNRPWTNGLPNMSRRWASTWRSGRVLDTKRNCNPALAVLAVVTLFCTSPYIHADEWEFSLAPLFLWGMGVRFNY